MRHLAWLNAPRKAPKGSDTPPPSRLVELQGKEEAGEPQTLLEMPPIDAAGHLVGYLFEVGPSIAGEVLSFQEIEAWQNATGTRLNSWEATTLRRLSAEYLAERQAAEDPLRIAPYIQDMDQHVRSVADRVKSALRPIKPEDVRQGPLPRPKRLQKPNTKSLPTGSPD